MHRVLQRTLTAVSSIPEKYPLAAIAAILMCVAGLKIVSAPYGDEDLYVPILMSLALLFLLSISGENFSRVRTLSTAKRLLIQLLIVCVVAMYYLLLPESINDAPSSIMIARVMWFGCAFALIFLSAYKNTDNSESRFLRFVAEIVSAILLGFLFAVIAFILGLLVIWALETLFGLNTFNDGTQYWWIVCATIVGPFVTLSRLPESAMRELPKTLPRPVTVLFNYIVIPFVLIYFAILYVYTGKIILTWEWPEGSLGWLIVVFSLIGWVCFTVIKGWQKSSKTYAKVIKWFPYILLPQIGMLFISLWWRVDAYGITLNRYFIGLLGVWLLLCCLYYIFSQGKKITFLFYSILILTFLASIGPWGAFSTSETSQVSLLKETAIDKGLLTVEGGVIRNSGSTLSHEEGQNISSKVRYIERTHGTKGLRKVFPQTIEMFNANDTCQTNCSGPLVDFLGLQNRGIDLGDMYSNTVSYHYDLATFSTPQDIAGYTTLLMIDMYSTRTEVESFRLGEREYLIEISDKGLLISTQDKTTLITISAKELLASAELTDEASVLTLDLAGEEITAQFFVSRVSGKDTEDNEKIDSLEGYMVLK